MNADVHHSQALARWCDTVYRVILLQHVLYEANKCVVSAPQVHQTELFKRFLILF